MTDEDSWSFVQAKTLGVGYLYLNDRRDVHRTVHVADRIMVDVAEDGTILGVEVLGLAIHDA